MARKKIQTQHHIFGPIEEVEVEVDEPAQDIVMPDGTAIDIRVTVTPAPKPPVELDEYHQENP